ncbi:NADH-quinone oxidoreductase subunit M [Candidatus Brocadia pituitae]|nr:NADH-quinone oxidoreductase subunit M [Candidatus Brocadia pituitae]
MILAWLIIIMMIGGLLAWLAGKWNVLMCRWIALITLIIDFIIIIAIWVSNPGNIEISQKPEWLIEFTTSWIPQFGIDFHLALDGLNLILVSLTIFLGIISVITSWTEITEHAGFFHFNILWILAGITGVFLSLDLFLFYFFWEVMLIPMYFLIGIWGHENRVYAAFKFLIFTQASGLLMFLSILALYFIHGKATGVYTFDYLQLLGTSLSTSESFILMCGFLIAFLVKLPAVPFHPWLPDAHTEAPTAGSVILAGLLLKTGAYGILRYALPLFPQSAIAVSPYAMVFGAIGILYGAKLAFAQTDFKRLVAYTSVSHMGFILLGTFAGNALALQGVVVQMLAHGISTGALFVIAGSIQERIHTRDMTQMGGLWQEVPGMAGAGLLFSLASLGLPGLGNFVAEFLILAGSYQVSIGLTIFAASGLIASTLYSLMIMQKVFYGKKKKVWNIKDLGVREMIMMGAMIVVIVWLGVFPQTFLNTARSSVNNILQHFTSRNTKVETGSVDKNNLFQKINFINMIDEKRSNSMILTGHEKIILRREH